MTKLCKFFTFWLVGHKVLIVEFLVINSPRKNIPLLVWTGGNFEGANVKVTKCDLAIALGCLVN